MICVCVSLTVALSLSQSYLKRFVWNSLTIFVEPIRFLWGGMNKKYLEISFLISSPSATECRHAMMFSCRFRIILKGSVV